MAAPSIEDLLIAADRLEAIEGKDKEQCARVASHLRTRVTTRLNIMAKELMIRQLMEARDIGRRDAKFLVEQAEKKVGQPMATQILDRVKAKRENHADIS